ncbi:hypothetical protein BJY14_008543 [Actinomadura luteofluorescens]|uniref:Uncharacterized protein n=1 Tax=Actinomadura luteofluorescens TaxID=46163 RepID=A0A7Y9ERD6_9ACTN|nr:hypothetical protein [Actinomadura luteofluorescens]
MSAANRGAWGVAPPPKERMNAVNQGARGIVPRKEDA